MMIGAFETITACRSCGSTSLHPFFDLGSEPLANSLPSRPDESEAFYPLSLSWCQGCKLVQLNETVDPERLFSEYVWVTGTSQAARDFAETFYKELIVRAPLGREEYVLEVASNDGTFLKPFLRDGYDALGVDPAQNIVTMAEKSGIPTKCAYFGVSVAREMLKERGPAKAIFARNVLPHVANTHDFVDGLREALRDDGVLAVETHYAKTILEGLHYDSIYHEHLCYFTLATLERLLNDHGLYVFDIIPSLISGGGIVVYAKRNRQNPSRAVLEYRKGEVADNTNEYSNWEEFARRASMHKEKLLGTFKEILQKQERIAGWGASARSSTLLNFCGIGPSHVPAIADLNPLKQKRYTAGTHIPILHPDAVMRAKPHYVLILAWNFADEIIEMLRGKYAFRGGYIVPLPGEPRVLT